MMEVGLVGGIGQAAPSARAAKIAEGARAFEAMMLEQMMKPMHFGGGVDAGDESTGGASETVAGFGTEAVAKALASGGGFGLARQIVRQVTAEDKAKGAKV